MRERGRDCSHNEDYPRRVTEALETIAENFAPHDENTLLETVALAVAEILDLMQRDKIHLHFTLNSTQEQTMQTLDPQHSFTDRKKPFGAFVGMAGTDSEGNATVVPDPSKPLEAKSSDEAQVGVDTIDGNHFVLTTPRNDLAEGEVASATITVQAPAGAAYRVEQVQFTFDYKTPTLDQINVSFDADVSDAQSA